MIVVIIFSHKCKINPDNVATPIAASLGDLTTLGVLASIGGFFFNMIGKHRTLTTCVCITIDLQNA
jgi:solute carrier family 41